MRKIPGIYVEIRGDFSDLKEKVSEAKKKVTEQARGMSDALNNALAPEQIKANVNGLVVSLGTLSRSAHLSGQNFTRMGVDLGRLQGVTGITSAEFAKLQSRMLETRAAGVQEKALKDLAKAADLSREEIKAMGAQFGLNVGQIDKVTAALHGAEAKVMSLSARIAAMPPIKPSVMVSGEAQSKISGATGAAVSGFATDLTALSQGGAIAGRAMNALSLDMAELRSHVGMTDAQFGKLESQFMRTHSEKAQSDALLNIARSAGLTEKEMRSLGVQMNVSRATMDETAASMANIGESTEFSIDKFRDMIVTIGIYTVAFQGLSSVMTAISKEFRLGFSSIEEFNKSVAASAAYITTFSEKAAQGDFAGAYKEASVYAALLAEKLEMIDAQTIASGTDLQSISVTLQKHGVLIDINNKKQLEGVANVATALSLVTAGQDKNIQMIQEINALMNGTSRPNDQLVKLLEAADEEWEKNWKNARKTGTELEYLAKTLTGFGADLGDLDKLWETVGSTMETINKRILRGGFEPAFNDLIGLAKKLNNSLMDAEGHLTPLAEGISQDIAGAYETGKKFVDDYGESLIRLGTILVEVKGMQLLLNLAVKANPWYAAGAGIAYVAHKLDVLAPTLKIAVEAVDEIIERLAALYSVATRGDKSLWDWITTGSEGLKEWQIELTNGVALLKEKKIELAEQRVDIAEGWAFTSEARKAKQDELEAIDRQTAALDRQISAIQKKDGLMMSSHGPKADDGMMPTSNHSGGVHVPKLRRAKEDETTDPDRGTSLASDMNAALKAQVEYLKAAEEKKAAIIQASAALILQANQNEYDTGLKYYRDYLDTKQKYTEEALQADLSAKKKELAEAQGAVKKLTPITDKEGNARPDKNAKAYSDALKQVEVAEKAAIESANKLKLAQVGGATEAAQAVSDAATAYREVHIQMLEMTGQTVAAAQARAQADSETVERSRLIIAAKAGEVGAVQALADVEQMARDAIKATELDKITIAKDALSAIAEINGEYSKSREIQIELLNVEIERAKLFGALPEQILLLQRQRKALGDLQDPAKAFATTWKSIAAEWGDTSMIMVDLATESAQAMQSAFSDFFFDAMTGKLEDLGGYVSSFVQSIQRALADAMSQKLVSSIIGGEGGLMASLFHTGGTVGADSTVMRQAPANLTGVPRYHSGLGSNEFLSILEKDETVFTKGQMKSLGDAVKSGRSDERSSTANFELNYMGGDKKDAERLRQVVDDAVREHIRKAV